jgi:hypothetical protein
VGGCFLSSNVFMVLVKANHLQNWHGILVPCTDQPFTEYKECSIDVFQNKFLTLVTIKTLLERKQPPTE